MENIVILGHFDNQVFLDYILRNQATGHNFIVVDNEKWIMLTFSKRPFVCFSFYDTATNVKV